MSRSGSCSLQFNKGHSITLVKYPGSVPGQRIWAWDRKWPGPPVRCHPSPCSGCSDRIWECLLCTLSAAADWACNLNTKWRKNKTNKKKNICMSALKSKSLLKHHHDISYTGTRDCFSSFLRSSTISAPSQSWVLFRQDSFIQIDYSRLLSCKTPAPGQVTCLLLTRASALRWIVP